MALAQRRSSPKEDVRYIDHLMIGHSKNSLEGGGSKGCVKGYACNDAWMVQLILSS